MNPFIRRTQFWIICQSKNSGHLLPVIGGFILTVWLSIGSIDPNAVVKIVKEVTEEDRRRQALMDARPPLDEILNLHDFEVTLTWRMTIRTGHD